MVKRMKLLLTLPPLLTLFLLSPSISTGTVYTAEDALILDSEPPAAGAVSSESTDNDLLTTTLLPLGSPSDECHTAEGAPGHCLKFRDCYPHFFRVQDPSYFTVANQLALLRNSSTRCVPGGEILNPGGESFVPSEDDHICCATLSSLVRFGGDLQLPAFQGNDLDLQPDPEMEKEEAEVRASCGVTQYSGNPLVGSVVQGREAQRGEFPWAVALFQNGRHHCGGSLISARHVVTAAHCVNHIRTGPQLQGVRIYIGAHDIYGGGDFQVRKVKKMAFHKGFNQQAFRDDIALLRLDSPVTLSSKIKPICFHPGSPAYDGGSTDADIAGWGKTSENGPPSRTLRTASIRIWTNSQCAQKYSGTLAPTISSGMVCAGTNGKDSCQGDSGGPLTLNKGGREYLVGIVSWGIKCGVYPGVYTRADQYLAWVEKYKTKLG